MLVETLDGKDNAYWRYAMYKVAQLIFTMDCPFYAYDPVRDEEEECLNIITIRYRDRDDWDVEGCPHVEDPATFAAMRNEIEDAIADEAIAQAIERAAAREYERSGRY